MIENNSSFSRLLERRRVEHQRRLGIHFDSLTLLDSPGWRETAVTVQGVTIVEALVRFDDTTAEEGSWPPARRDVATFLVERSAYLYYPASQPDHPDFPLCWIGGGADRAPQRAWFIVSDKPLEVDALTTSMPKRYQAGSEKRGLLLEFPVLRPGLAAARLSAETSELRGETERIVLTGVEAATILAVGQGRDAGDVAEALAQEWPAEEVHFALSRLRTRGLIEEACARFSDWEEDFWRASGVDRQTAARRMADAVVAVHGPPQVREALARWAVTIADEGGRAPTAELVIVDDYVHGAGLELANRRALTAGRPWMLAKVTGRVAWIGPAMRPGKTACWGCLEWRLRENRATAPGPGMPGLVSTAAADLVAAEMARWLANDGGWLEGRIITFDAWSLTHRSHPVLRREHCEACGRPPVSPPALDSVRLDLGAESDEPVALEETAARLRRLVSPLTGLVPELREMPGASPFSVYYSRVNGALGSKANAAGLRNDGWQALGKSRTRLRAEVGCMAEAVERYSSGFHQGEPMVSRSWREWGAGEAVHPSSIVLYSKRQWEQRAAWNSNCGRSNMVFAPFDEEQPAEWRPVWSLSRQTACWMAADLCFIDYPSHPEREFCLGDSNGCAAGNTKAEALMRAILELIERDAVAVWWYNRLPRPAVNDVVLAGAPAVESCRALLAERGRGLAVLDLTNDVRVPAAVAVSWRQREGDQVLLGIAAELSLSLAAERAAEGLCQLLPWPGERIGDRDWSRWWTSARIETESWLLPSAAAQRVECPQLPTKYPDAVAELERRLAALGLETLACDLTRPDAGFPVMRAIVPGLRHFHAHLGPGRLYDTPVRLGWLDAPVREEDMNDFLFPL